MVMSMAVIAPTRSDFCSNGLNVFRKFLQPLVLIACACISSSALAQSVQPNIVIILAQDSSSIVANFGEHIIPTLKV
jgi:hypothetical protein